MNLSRREFVILSSAIVCGCKATGENARSGSTKPLISHDVDAGPIEQFASDGLWTDFQEQGFFVVRRQGRMVALSSICTHRDCKLSPIADQSYVCKCHGSRFDPQGHVTKGPALRDLPHYATTVDERNHLIVHVGKHAAAGQEKA
jgi:Rieske Fe-S protein